MAGDQCGVRRDAAVAPHRPSRGGVAAVGGGRGLRGVPRVQQDGSEGSAAEAKVLPNPAPRPAQVLETGHDGGAAQRLRPHLRQTHAVEAEERRSPHHGGRSRDRTDPIQTAGGAGVDSLPARDEGDGDLPGDQGVLRMPQIRALERRVHAHILRRTRRSEGVCREWRKGGAGSAAALHEAETERAGEMDSGCGECDTGAKGYRRTTARHDRRRRRARGVAERYTIPLSSCLFNTLKHWHLGSWDSSYIVCTIETSRTCFLCELDRANSNGLFALWITTNYLLRILGNHFLSLKGVSYGKQS